MDRGSFRGSCVQDDQGVDLEVGKVKVGVDGVEADQEIGEHVLLCGRDGAEQSLFDHFAGGQVAVDWDEELECLGVHVANLDSSLVGEENDISLSDRVDADIELGVGGVGQERLDDETREGTSDRFDLSVESFVNALN